MNVGNRRAWLAVVVVGMVMAASVVAPTALANSPLGACCLPKGGCENLTDAFLAHARRAGAMAPEV